MGTGGKGEQGKEKERERGGKGEKKAGDEPSLKKSFPRPCRSWPFNVTVIKFFRLCRYLLVLLHSLVLTFINCRISLGLFVMESLLVIFRLSRRFNLRLLHCELSRTMFVKS